MTALEGVPSDDLPDVLATGRSDVSALFVSFSARHPDGRDAEYLRWHSLDHRPEQHRLDGLRGSLRLVSTPACRVARAAAASPYDDVDHVMTYLFRDRSVVEPFYALGAALGAGGRMPLRLPSLGLATFDVAGMVAAPEAVIGADILPWRPARGVYLLLEEGGAPAGELTSVTGVAGAWWATSDPTDGEVRQVTFCFLDDDPVEVAVRIRPALQRRWEGSAVAPLLAGPFHVAVPFDWDRYLP
jgi:hypothetical protein